MLWSQTLFEGTEGQNRCVLGVSNLLKIWEENIVTETQICCEVKCRAHKNKKDFKESLCLKQALCPSSSPQSSPPSAKEYYLRSPKIFHGSCNTSKLPMCSKNLKEFQNPIEKMDFSIPDTVYKSSSIILMKSWMQWKWKLYETVSLYRFPKGWCFQNITYYSVLNFRINDLRIWSGFVFAFCFCDWCFWGENVSVPTEYWL